MFEDIVKNTFADLKKQNQESFFWKLYCLNTATGSTDRNPINWGNKTEPDYDRSLEICLAAITRYFETGTKYIQLVILDKYTNADGTRITIPNPNLKTLEVQAPAIGNPNGGGGYYHQAPAIGFPEILGLVTRNNDKEDTLKEKIHEKDLEILKLQNEIHNLENNSNSKIGGFLEGIFQQPHMAPVLGALIERLIPPAAMPKSMAIASTTPTMPQGPELGALFELKNLMAQHGVDSAYMLGVAKSFFTIKTAMDPYNLNSKELLEMFAVAANADPVQLIENIKEIFMPENDTDDDTAA